MENELRGMEEGGYRTKDGQWRIKNVDGETEYRKMNYMEDDEGKKMEDKSRRIDGI